jgi:hypothetical protein
MKHTKKHTLRYHVLVLFLLVLGCTIQQGGQLHAQNSIGFSNIGFTGMPDTVQAGTSTPVGAFLENLSAFNDYSDSVQIVGYIDTGSVNTVPISFPVTYFQLAAGASQFVIMPVSFTEQQLGGYFRIGSNTIVIWPISFDPNFDTGDSLHATVVILPAGTGGPVSRPGTDVRCFPVPASGPLYITSQNAMQKPVSVVVRDMAGKTVAVSSSLENGIDTEPWPAGIYFLEVTFDDGTTGTYKISRQ